MELWESVNCMLQNIISITGKDISVAMYGSVILEDFRLGWSDLDIICLTAKPLSALQAEKLVTLRQDLFEKYPGNKYFRLFEGGILSQEAFFKQQADRVIYWGTSGQKLKDMYVLGAFEIMQMVKYRKVLYGKDVFECIKYPQKEEIISAINAHLQTIRKYGHTTGQSIYSIGWLLDIARCLYTLKTNDIISKTAAGEWALKEGLAPDKKVLQKAIEIRKKPLLFDDLQKTWAEKLDTYVQAFADVLQKHLEGV